MRGFLCGLWIFNLAIFCWWCFAPDSVPFAIRPVGDLLVQIRTWFLELAFTFIFILYKNR